jgi:hypothetical protein
LTFVSSPARRGLDLLLANHPGFEVVSAEWQMDGPWLLVTLGRRGESLRDAFVLYPWAVFKATGAVHGMNGGAVTDDPLFTL